LTREELKTYFLDSQGAISMAIEGNYDEERISKYQ